MPKTLGTISLPYRECGTHAECRYCDARIAVPRGTSYVEAQLIGGWFELKFVDQPGGKMLTGHGCQVPS